jgi:4-amino-4-deoxy-L-arabinose transferase-like glycosyltransferase
MKYVSKLRTLADDFWEFLEQQPVWSLLYFSVFFFGATLSASRIRYFWYDELATFYISRLPDWTTIFAALAAGADLNPPTLYFFTRLSQFLFGSSEVATRLPATFGFLLMLLCVNRYIARRTGNAIAFAAMCFPLVSGAYIYSYEARPYGLMLGFVGAALLFWQSAGSATRPLVACVGLALSLAITATTHAYAVLAIGPFLLAEIVRYWQTRQTRWSIWAALIAPFAALGFYLPLLANQNAAVYNNGLIRPDFNSIAKCFHDLLDPGFFPLLIVCIFGIWTNASPTSEAPRTSTPTIPLEELAIGAGFLLIPVGAVAVSMTITNVFFARYGLAAIVGITLVLAYLLARFANRSSPVLTTFVFLFWFVLIAVPLPLFQSANSNPEAPTLTRIEDIRPDLPVVVSNGLFFLPLAHYSEVSYAQRLHYLTDSKAAVKYSGANAWEVAYPITKKWYGFPGSIESYSDFMARGTPFLLLGPSGHQLEWLTKKLIDDGAYVRLISVRPEMMICEVTPASKPK